MSDEHGSGLPAKTTPRRRSAQQFATCSKAPLVVIEELLFSRSSQSSTRKREAFRRGAAKAQWTMACRVAEARHPGGLIER
jgi:hypothetical protein